MRIERRKTSFVLAVVVAAAVSCQGGLALATNASSGGAAASGGASAVGSEVSRAARGRAIATWFGPGFYGQLTACGATSADRSSLTRRSRPGSKRGWQQRGSRREAA